ncbi:MAG: hypothetical protein P8X42_00415 [Calditrichaceae bacterium]
MIIDKKKDISFTEFYLMEFFSNTLNKGAESIPEDNFHTLKELSNYLLAEDNVVDGLEKLAQYQGTSEFAIFLFDMVDRIQDFSPFSVVTNVADLAEDFINLYQLMIEDSDSVAALDSALSLFRKDDDTGRAGREAKQKKTKADTPLLSFAEFYQKEMDKYFDEALSEANLKDRRCC